MSIESLKNFAEHLWLDKKKLFYYIWQLSFIPGVSESKLLPFCSDTEAPVVKGGP